MRKSILALMVCTSLALSHITVFALTPLTETGMKTPSARAGLHIPIAEPIDFKGITQVFHTDADTLIGTFNLPSLVILNENSPAAPGAFSDNTHPSGSHLIHETDIDLEEELSSMAIDEVTRLNVLTTAPAVMDETDHTPKPPSNLIFHFESSLK